MQNYNFKNKNILITGAANGLGYHIAIELARNGANLILIDKDFENLNKLKELIKNNINIYHYDLKNINNINVLLKQIEQKYSNIDCIINNAAYELAGFIDELEINEILNQYNANFFSGIAIIKKFVKSISKNNGKIVNISSDAGFRGVPTRSIYCSSKSAIYFFSEALRLELKKYNVSVVTIIPPKLNSTFWEHIEYSGSIKEKPLKDKRKTYDTKKFAIEVVSSLQKNKIIITKRFRTIKLFTFLNYIFPLIADKVVKKFTNIEEIKRDKF